MPHRAYIPNSKRAAISGKIVTVHQGKRLVREYESGEPLVGKLIEDNAPPFTGFVRGWFQGKGKKKQ